MGVSAGALVDGAPGYPGQDVTDLSAQRLTHQADWTLSLWQLRPGNEPRQLPNEPESG